MDFNSTGQHVPVFFSRESDLAVLQARGVFTRGSGQQSSNILPSGTVLPRPLPTLQCLNMEDFPSSTQGLLQSRHRPEERRLEYFSALPTHSYRSYQPHPSMIVQNNSMSSVSLPAGQMHVGLRSDEEAHRLGILQRLNNTMEQELERFRKLRSGLAEACIRQVGGSAEARHAEDIGQGLHPSNLKEAAKETEISKNTKAISKKVRKKEKGKPRRPLSAYNLFFKDERARILAEIPESLPSSSPDGKKTRKRKNRPHGKIGFESLAKVIGRRWQQLTPGKLHQYKEMAASDMKRYKAEMEVYLAAKETSKTSELVSSGDNRGGDGPKSAAASKKVGS